MTSVILSSIEIPALIELIVSRVSEEIQRVPSPAPPTPQAEPRRLYGDAALAAYVGCSILTIRKMKARLPRYRTGRKSYYLSDEIDNFFRVNTPKRFSPKNLG